eukprot:m.1665673 g.1665673  ORF g.1665673 m.1665673 type:complete len:50 (+) comp142586_c0_seq1:99-248(+)
MRQTQGVLCTMLMVRLKCNGHGVYYGAAMTVSFECVLHGVFFVSLPQYS